MCMTDYIKERAQEIEKTAHAKIEIIDKLISHVVTSCHDVGYLPRAGALAVLLLGMHVSLMEEKAAALRVIEDAIALRRATKDLVQS